MLQAMVGYLKLDAAAAQAIAMRSRQRHAKGQLGESRSLSPHEIYRKVAGAGKKDDPLRANLLGGLRQLFRISEEVARKLEG